VSAVVWTTLELLRWTCDYFEQHEIASPRLDAELLLAYALEKKRLDLYLDFEKEVEEQGRDRFRELVKRRAQERVPVAYLTGEREFWSQVFHVNEDVLIPRPETELLVRLGAALEPERVLELGTGSGAVAIALALERPDAAVTAVDRSARAAAVARRNAQRLEVDARVRVLCGDLAESLSGSFDLIAMNPPYIPSADLAELEAELAHEPRLALDGGEDGLDLLRRVIADAPARLCPGGHLALEVGAGQAADVQELLIARGAEQVDVHDDLAGIPRVLLARFAAGAASA